MTAYWIIYLGTNKMRSRTVTLDGTTLNTLDVFDVSYGHALVEISGDAMQRVHIARNVVDRIVEGDETVYGINTGFGSLVHTQVSHSEVEQLQLNLIRSHATGIGPNLSTEIVRSMMCVRLNSLVKGHSGCHPDVVLQLQAFLNNRIHPIVHVSAVLAQVVILRRYPIWPVLLSAKGQLNTMGK